MSKVLILGHRGFLGQGLVKSFGAQAAIVDEVHDFTDALQAQLAIQNSGANIVINAAGKCGGISANQKYPGDFFYQNLLMGINLIEAANQHRVKKFVQIGSVCSYPKDCPSPMSEKDFWNGYPEITNGAYGMAKKALVVMGQAYNEQYGLKALNPILANLYGPGDHYQEDRSHVIPAMIRKFSEAVEHGDKSVTLWGSGKCTREFLYVEDAADAIKFLLNNFHSSEVINVSSGYEISVKDLAVLVAEACGFKGSIKWDTSKPDGQPRRHFSTSKLAALGWKTKTSLADGIYKTVADYKTRTGEYASAS